MIKDRQAFSFFCKGDAEWVYAQVHVMGGSLRKGELQIIHWRRKKKKDSVIIKFFCQFKLS